MRIQRFFLVSVLAVAAPTAVAAPNWVRIESPHFEMFTNAGERSGRRTVLYFEKVRTFFHRTADLGEASAFPARLILFRTRKELTPFQPYEAAAAYTLAGLNRGTVVMAGSDHPARMAAVHQYIHLLAQRSEAELPPWLEEGLAGLYSTLEPQGSQVKFGDMPAQLLRERQWLPLGELVSIERDSPFCQEHDRASLFHAQSWAFTHMIFRSRQFRERFPNFLAGATGDTGEAAFRWVYGKSLEQIEIDFKRHVSQKKFPGAEFEIVLNQTAPKAKAHVATETEVDLVKADLLVGLKKREQALEIYRDLARRHPGDWRIPEALGYLASYSGDEESARRHFARAVKLEAANPRLYYDFARLLQEADAEPEVIKAVLRKAIALKPDFDDGHRLLGSILLLEGKAGMALAQLMRVKQISREEAVPHYQTVAQLYHRMGRLEAARQAAILCRKYARSSEEVDLAEELMEWLGVGSEDAPHEAPPPLAAAGTPGTAASAPHREESDRPSNAPGDTPGSLRAPPRAEVQGSFSRLDCLGERARLHLLVEGKPLALAILNAATVRVSGPEAGLVDLSCGEQESRPVTVEYQPSEDADFGTEGIVKAIQFR